MAASQTQGNYELYRKYIESAFRQYQERQDLKTYTDLILTSLAIIIFSLFAIKPTAVTIIKLYKEMKAKEQTIQRMDQKISSLEQAEKIYNDNKDSIDLLNQAIPDSPKPEIFIRQIEGIAQTHSVTLSNMNLEEAVLKASDSSQEDIIANQTPANTPIQESEQNASVRVTANYPILIDFLKDIENMRSPYKFTIPSLTLYITRDSEDLYLEIEGGVLYLPK
jgi:cell division protein FtsB